MEVVMKKRFALMAALAIIAVTGAKAEDPVLPSNANRALIEENLMVGLNSDNEGLRYSCALMLGSIKSESAVIPLMALLKQCDSFKLKRAAAWALCNIGDERGTYAVKMEVRFSECCKTRLVCAWYYENMVKPGSFVFNNVDPTMIAELDNSR
jgi:hypothetical protein